MKHDTNGMTDVESAHTRKLRFMTLLGPAHDRLERFALAMTRNVEEARDLTAETILRAYEHFNELRNPEAFVSYLFTTASRVHKRRRWRGRIFGDYDGREIERIRHDGAAPDLSADVEILHRALTRLPESQREAVVLFEITGLSLEEIREIQGGSLSGVKSRLVRGRKRLARLLGVNDDSGASGAPVIAARVGNRAGSIDHYVLFQAGE